MDHLISARRPDLLIINNNKKKKKICTIVDFALPADHRINLKEYEKKDKYLDLARELKKLWTMKVTIIPIVIDAFGTVTKELLKGLEDLEVGGRVETIQTTALVRTAKLLRRVLETWGDLLSLKLLWKTDRLYVSRKEGGRGLDSIEETVDTSIQQLEDYIENHERGLITAVRNDTDNTIDDRMTITRGKMGKKQLYGRFKWLINNISRQKTWTWLR